jgi:hypothetical protein
MDLTEREKLAMIRLREEMQREKPTMLNCSKDAHIFEVFSFIILIYGVGDSKGAGFFPSLKHLGPTSHSGRVRIIGFFLGTCTLYINTLYIASFKNCCCNYRRELTNTFYNLIQHVLFIQSSKLI